MDAEKKNINYDISGQRFGKLTVVEDTGQRQNRAILWRCRCDCGKETVVITASLKNGNTRSCGCLHKETFDPKRGMDYVDGTCIQHISNTDKLSVRNTSGYRGVYPYRGRWATEIVFKRKRYHLGTYIKIEDAAKARKRAEEMLYGEFLKQYAEKTSQQEK